MKKFICIACLIMLLSAWNAQAQTAKEQSVVESVLLGAVAEMQSGNIDSALRQLEFIDKKYPGNDAVNYYMGVCHSVKRNLPEAEKRLEAAVRADSTNVWYKDLLASIYLESGKAEQGANLYLQLLAEHPAKYTNAYTMTLLGNKNLSAYQDSLAMDNFDKALALSPDYAPALLGKGEVYRMRNNIPAFLSTVNEIASSPAVNPLAKSDYINQILKHIDYNFYQLWGKQLDSLVATCASVHPSDSSTLMLAGNWFYGTGRKERGRAYFDQLLEAMPQSLSAHYIRLQMIMGDGATAREVIDECEAIIKLGGEKNPEVLPAMAAIGDTYHRMGQERNAFKAYERVLKADPEYLPVLNNYAYYLSLKGKKLKKAAAMSKITVEKDPDNATYLDTYGWILHLQGLDQKAKPYFKHAMLYGGRDSAVILGHYADVLDALGEHDLAKSFRMLAENKPKEEE